MKENIFRIHSIKPAKFARSNRDVAVLFLMLVLVTFYLDEDCIISNMLNYYMLVILSELGTLFRNASCVNNTLLRYG